MARGESSSVRQEFGKLLQSRLALSKPEQMKELLRLLRHKDADLVVVGLKVVQAKKEDAADLAPEVADLLEDNRPKVREASVEALQGSDPPPARRCPRYSRVLAAAQVSAHVPGPHRRGHCRCQRHRERGSLRFLPRRRPASRKLKVRGEGSETAINRVLLKIGQPAVEGIFQVINPEFRGGGKDEIIYRKTLYKTLAGLGSSCRAQANYERLLRLRNKENRYKDVRDAAGAAMFAMDPK